MTLCIRVYGLLKPVNDDAAARPASWTNHFESSPDLYAWLGELQADRTNLDLFVAITCPSYELLDQRLPFVSSDEDNYLNKFYQRTVSMIQQGHYIGHNKEMVLNRVLAWAELVKVKPVTPKSPPKGHWWELPPVGTDGFSDRTMNITRLLCGGSTK